MPLTLIIGGLLLLMFGQSLGLSETYEVYESASSKEPDFTVEHHRLPFAVGLPVIAMVVFAVAFLPDRKTARAPVEAAVPN